MLESDLKLYSNYEDTIKYLKEIWEKSEKKIKSNPHSIILNDGMIVGILTMTNQFVQIFPLKKYEEGDEGELEIINNNDYVKVENETMYNYRKTSEFLEDKERIEKTDFDVVEKFDRLNIIKNGNSKVSSYITIQEGCDKFCKFCVVPYTRGPENSRSLDHIISEAQTLVKNGSKEIK